jgi:peptide/nickel transport system ATP-binding protein
MAQTPITIEGLTVAEARSGLQVIEDVTLHVRQGELLAIVGESGAGKTTAGLALLGYARAGLRIVDGRVRVGPVEITALSGRELDNARGRVVSFVPQNPSTTLNPSQRVGEQVRDALAVHCLPAGESEVAGLFEHVSLPVDRSFIQRFPHQLSGGQKQRVSIALALACRPDLVVLDEPTTALDVVTQARILQLISDLRQEGSSAFVYVTHDIAAVAQVATHVAIMYAGRVVEYGPLSAILGSPRHPYAKALIAAVPSVGRPQPLHGIAGVAPSLGGRPPGCAFAPRCSFARELCREAVPALEPVGPDGAVRCVRWREIEPDNNPIPERERGRQGATELLQVRALSASYRQTGLILDSVSLSVSRGECVAVVGESGSGKTTLARCIVGLHKPSTGEVLLDNVALKTIAQRRSRDERRRIQIVFQNPDESLNPRMRVGDIISRPARQLSGLDKRQANERTAGLLTRVGLAPELAHRYPAQLSGGERQRVSIARSLAADPSLLVCDEVTSALDVSVQASVIELLIELRETSGLALLFISHDLAVVSAIANRVLVLDKGHVCDEGAFEHVMGEPSSDYTRRLIAAVPKLPT